MNAIHIYVYEKYNIFVNAYKVWQQFSNVHSFVSPVRIFSYLKWNNLYDEFSHVIEMCR